jgi:hypothetical protein
MAVFRLPFTVYRLTTVFVLFTWPLSVGIATANGEPKTVNGKRKTLNVKRHDFHSSLAEVSYNPAAKSLEVSLRMFTDDLGEALTRENKRTVSVDQTDTADPLIKRYLEKHFAVAGTDNRRKPMTWVGKEISVDVTWVYFEIPLTESLNGMKLLNSLLCELFDDQVNIVNVSYQGQKRTYLFKPNQTVQEIAF